MFRARLLERFGNIETYNPKESVILSSVSRPARILDYNVLTYRPGILLPKIITGSAYGDKAGVWYTIHFPESLSTPQVVAVAEGRGTSFVTRTIKKPSDITTKTIPRVDVSRTTIETNIKNKLGDWGWYNQIRDWIASGLSYIFKWVFDVIVGDQIDYVQSKLNETIGDFNSKVNKQLSNVTSAVNDRLKDLFKMWGVPNSVAMTPVHIRNVTSTGFDFLSLGKTKIHYIAVGK